MRIPTEGITGETFDFLYAHKFPSDPMEAKRFDDTVSSRFPSRFLFGAVATAITRAKRKSEREVAGKGIRDTCTCYKSVHTRKKGYFPRGQAPYFARCRWKTVLGETFIKVPYQSPYRMERLWLPCEACYVVQPLDNVNYTRTICARGVPAHLYIDCSCFLFAWDT